MQKQHTGSFPPGFQLNWKTSGLLRSMASLSHCWHHVAIGHLSRTPGCRPPWTVVVRLGGWRRSGNIKVKQLVRWFKTYSIINTIINIVTVLLFYSCYYHYTSVLSLLLNVIGIVLIIMVFIDRYYCFYCFCCYYWNMHMYMLFDFTLEIVETCLPFWSIFINWVAQPPPSQANFFICPKFMRQRLVELYPKPPRFVKGRVLTYPSILGI